MSREYIDNPEEDSAWSLRRLNETLEELVEEMRLSRETTEMLFLTDEKRHRLAEARKERHEAGR